MILDEVAARHRSASAGEGRETAELAEALASARQRLAALTVRGIRNDPPERYRRLLEQARVDKDRTEGALAENSAKFRDDQSRSRIDLREVSAALPSESALVSFVRYRHQDLEHPETIAASGADAESAYLAFVLRAGAGAPVVVPLGSAAGIDRLILQWRRQLDQQAMAPAGMGTSRGEAAYRRIAGELRQQTWDPFLSHLSNARRVFVVPEGALHLVSFAALPTASSHYLVETGPVIHYLSAERDLVPPEAGRISGRGLLVLGGPAFDESTLRPVASAASFRGTRSACPDFQSVTFDPLPASVKEVDEVLTLWNRAHRVRAQGAQLRSVMPSPPDTIRLTGAAASEGLRRAFQVAGAKTVIMSLWSVEDETTRQWMLTLYRGRLLKNLSTSDAMREASLAVLRQRRTKGLSTHPFHWAAFVAAGDWR